MAVYSVKADILEILSLADLIQLTDDVAPVDTVDDPIVVAAISRADTRINTYLRGKHTVPFSTVPASVRNFSVTLAIFELYRRRVNLEIPDVIRIDFDQVIKDLKLIQGGQLVLDDSTSVANTASFYKGQGKGTTSDKPQIWDSKPDGTGQLDEFYNGPC